MSVRRTSDSPCGGLNDARAGGHWSVQWQAEGRATWVAVVLGVWGIMGTAFATDSMQKLLPVTRYPTPSGTVTWSGALSGSKTFRTAFCIVDRLGSVGLWAPGHLRRPLKEIDLYNGKRITNDPSTRLFVNPGKLGTTDFRIGQQYTDLSNTRVQGAVVVRQGGRYGVTLRQVPYTMYAKHGPPGQQPKDIRLNGTLWCTSVVRDPIL